MRKFLSLIALILAFACLFTSCIQIDQGGANGTDGKDGVDGKDGKDGFTPTIEISPDGYWVINGVKTEYKAVCDCSNCCNCNNNSGDNESDNDDHIHNFVEGKCECGETDPDYILSLADALEAALPAGDGEFTKMFMVEIVEGFDAIYEATNGAGYVCVIGTDSTGTFIGVGSDGVALGDNENNALVEAAVAIVSATTLTDIDVSMYNQSGVATDIRRIFRVINYVQKTATGNYVIEIQCDGHGKKGDPSHEYASGERYTIKVSISADGVIIDSQTISHSETPTWGGPQLEDGAYNSNFIGKNEIEAGGVDTVAGTTNTTGGYKEAILHCFTAIEIIEGE